MNNTQKILVAVGVGIGVAYLYNRYKKVNTKSSTGKGDDKNVLKSSDIPENAAISDMSREEKEEFILNTVSATPKEMSSGFEGVRFVFNPLIGKMYPVGTIVEGQEPSYDDVFNQAEGTSQRKLVAPKNILVDNSVSASVQNAEKILQGLTDQEIDLLYQIVKTLNENPSIKSEEEAVKKIGVTNPNIIKLVRQKFRNTLNDIKVLKTDSEWNEKWNARKEFRRKRRSDFKQKMGLNKSDFERLANRRCGRRPKNRNVAEYKKCIENLANKIRTEMKNEIRSELSSAPVSVKEEVNSARQRSFVSQVTNRDAGGIFAGKRWDGESNAYVESLVDQNLV